MAFSFYLYLTLLVSIKFVVMIDCDGNNPLTESIKNDQVHILRLLFVMLMGLFHHVSDFHRVWVIVLLSYFHNTLTCTPISSSYRHSQPRQHSTRLTPPRLNPQPQSVGLRVHRPYLRLLDEIWASGQVCGIWLCAWMRWDVIRWCEVRWCGRS